jgi:lipid II:glycine glycyltransferase (peptidoglycan interpeptide bridge formation enzyme)
MENRAPMLTLRPAVREPTLFCQERFIEAVVRAEDKKYTRSLRIQSSQSAAYITGLEYVRKFNTRSVWLAPFGLYAYPIHGDRSLDCVSSLVAQLKTFRTRNFQWNVRFDHQELAKELTDCGLDCVETTTHVLYLDHCYDELFRRFTASTRNQIRAAERKGVVVNRATNEIDVKKYWEISKKIDAERGRTGHTKALFDELLKLTENVIFLTATVDHEMIGGGWFFRDGNSLMYWNSAINYQYKTYYPVYAIVGSAIRTACEEAMASFNMGGSLGVSSLEQFKSFWGARKVPCWAFAWSNPIWSSVLRILRRAP